MDESVELRADGRPCRARALPGKDRCFAHDASLREKREQAYVTGGQNRANASRAQRLLPSQLKPVMTLLITAMKETHDGTLEPARLSAMAAAASAVGRLFGTVEVEQRLAELESRIHEHAS